MEFLTNNLTDFLIILLASYHPLLFLLPPSVASKISVGVKILKTVSKFLEEAEKSKGGFSPKIEEKVIKPFIQKSRV
jgi:hypothetical protein